MAIGQVFKIHSDFYYVNFEGKIYETKLREILKKSKQSVYVGDFVEFNDGAIEKVLPRTNRVVVEGVNLRKKHKKPTQNNPEGSIVEIYAPIDASNVQILDPKTKKPARIGHKIVKGKKVRVTVGKNASGSQL